MKKVLYMIFIGLVLSMTARADDYDPTNPADPYMNYKVTASVTPDGAGTASTTGKYKPGTVITMNTSANKDYTFLRWEKNGVEYTTSKSFKYTVEAANVDFVAVYEYSPAPPEIYNPTNPADPFFTEKPETVYYTLTLVGNPVEACSFNLSSGISVEQDTFVKLEAYGNQNYDFVGWYQNGRKVGSTEVFNYQMTSNATLTAMYKVYDPAAPDDPASSMENTPRYKLGDMNDDGILDITDAISVIGAYINNEDVEMAVADYNGDKTVDVSDAIAIIDKYLNTKEEIVFASSIILSETSLKLGVNQSVRLTSSLLPSNATSKKVTWASSDESIASIDQNGLITANALGTCSIICKAKDGSGTMATCEVEVINAMLPSNAFEFNYNFRDYDAVNHRVPNNEKANLSDYNLQLSGTYPVWNKDHITINSIAKGSIDKWSETSTESGRYFYRSGSNSMTIVVKVAPQLNVSGNPGDLICNRGSGYNYMFRVGDFNSFYLHTSTAYSSSRSLVLNSSEPQVLVVRVDGTKNTIRLDNMSTGESKMLSGINWGGSNNIFKLFYNDNSEYYLGDVYWMYYSFECIDDDAVNAVIKYNNK